MTSPRSSLAFDLLQSGAAVCVSRGLIARIRGRSAHAEVQWLIRNSCRQIADARECMHRLDDSLRRQGPTFAKMQATRA
jgi:hypothetical protein